MHFWGNSSRLCTLDSLTLQDMAQNSGFVTQSLHWWDAAWPWHYLRDTETATPPPSCQKIRWVCVGPHSPEEPRASWCGAVASPGGILHKAGWPRATRAAQGRGWGSLPGTPCTSDCDAAPWASDHCRWPWDQGPYRGQGPAFSPPALSLLWGSASLSSQLLIFVTCQSNDIICSVNIAVIAIISGFLAVRFSEKFQNMSI